MKISILMANFNNGRYISEAIESVLRQTNKNWELIVVDDASTDNSSEIVRKYSSDSRIRFFQNKDNIGYIKTLMKMTQLSKSEVLGILDSDDVLEEDALGKVMSVYDNDADVGFVYTKLAFCDSDLKKTGEELGEAIPNGKSNIHYSYTGAFRTFKKKVYDKTDGFDDSINYAEDRDLILKMEEVTKFYFVDKSLYLYRRLLNTHTTDPQKAEIGKINHAIAKYKAFQRRLGTTVPNLTKRQMSSELWFVLPSCIKIHNMKKFKFCLVKAVSLSPLNFFAMSMFLGRIIKFPFYRMVRKIYPNIEKVYK